MEIYKDDYLMSIQAYRARDMTLEYDAEADAELFSVLLRKLVGELRGANENKTPFSSTRPLESYSVPGHIRVQDLLDACDILGNQ